MTTKFDPKAAEESSKTNSTQPPTLYGTDEHIAALVRRMRFMIAGCADAPDEVVWRAASIAIIHRLDPFSRTDIHVWSPYKKPQKPDDYIVDIGISAWRRKAQTQAKYMPTFRLLEPAEIQHHRGERYHPADVGAECILYRLDVAAECKKISIPYEPVITQGFWRMQAFWSSSDQKWLPDSLAETETSEAKAKRRSEKKALKIAFHLDMPDEEQATEDAQWKVMEALNQKTTTEERLRAPVADLRDYSRPDWDLFA